MSHGPVVAACAGAATATMMVAANSATAPPASAALLSGLRKMVGIGTVTLLRFGVSGRAPSACRRRLVNANIAGNGLTFLFGNAERPPMLALTLWATH